MGVFGGVGGGICGGFVHLDSWSSLCLFIVSVALYGKVGYGLRFIVLETLVKACGYSFMRIFRNSASAWAAWVDSSCGSETMWYHP